MVLVFNLFLLGKSELISFITYIISEYKNIALRMYWCSYVCYFISSYLFLSYLSFLLSILLLTSVLPLFLFFLALSSPFFPFINSSLFLLSPHTSVASFLVYLLSLSFLLLFLLVISSSSLPLSYSFLPPCSLFLCFCLTLLLSFLILCPSSLAVIPFLSLPYFNFHTFPVTSCLPVFFLSLSPSSLLVLSFSSLCLSLSPWLSLPHSLVLSLPLTFNL